MSVAERIAQELRSDGLTFVTGDGRRLDKLASEAGARESFARTVLVEDEDGREQESVEEVSRSDIHDFHRYGFEDGSAIVVANGSAWDVEGTTPFSWEG